ncbi:hypothetical protein BH23CYA1_BH23CYA1_15980 [soil metagenome]|uniref:photosystem II assembly protein Psb35 n=1 Tax=Leptolyngbya sp. BC1307 TaxID=2029589 RepID=UPI000EFC0385
MVFMQAAGADTLPYSLVLTVVGLVGFAAAVGIGSVAWYNSKRPVGWEDKARPDVVPEIDKDS